MSKRILATAVLLFGLTSTVHADEKDAKPQAIKYETISASQLPEKYRGKSREGFKQVPFTMLRQKPIEIHRIEPGDVLGINLNRAPISLVSATLGREPAPGQRIRVQSDGTISLLNDPPIKVAGLTLAEVEEEIAKAQATIKNVFKHDNERFKVALLQPRTFNVLVIRTDSGTGGLPKFSNMIDEALKGSYLSLDLPRGENDVLNAVAKTGGLPGTDAKNEVLVCKKSSTKNGPPIVIRIPLRIKSDKPIPFKPEDVVLDDGDVVCIESRVADSFRTSGLFGKGEYPLPRDYDLDIIKAINYARPPVGQGGFGQAQFLYDLDLKSWPSCAVFRTTPDGKHFKILVDLERAMKNPSERLLVLPGDLIVFQEKPGFWKRFLTRMGL